MTDPDDTQDVYVRNAAQFDRVRDRSLFECSWLERFCADLPDKASILDVGCGAGEPVSRHLVEQGYAVTGVDFAEPLLDMARVRFPSAEWIACDMRNLDLGRQFDGVIAWHSIFHLTPDEQRKTLPVLADHVAPGGVLMATVGPEAGEISGYIAGEAVYHASLSEEEYRRLLVDAGMDVVAFVRNDEDCGNATVVIAVKRRQPKS